MNKSSRSALILKWSLVTFIILLIACVVYMIFLYYEIQQTKTSGYTDVKEIVLRDTEVTEIDQILRFHGDKAYYVVYGKTIGAEEQIVFIPFEQKQDDEGLTVIHQKDTISKDSIINKWQEQCNNCKLIKVIPGMLNNEPLWEITYIDPSDRYVFDYLSIYDGSQYEQLRFKRMFH